MVRKQGFGLKTDTGKRRAKCILQRIGLSLGAYLDYNLPCTVSGRKEETKVYL